MCHVHRCIWPFRWLSKDAPQHEWKVSTSDQVGGFDAIYLYGARNFSDWQEVSNLKRKGIRLIYTHDDSIWHHPEWRKDQPSREHVASVNLACELADLIVASTPALADAIGKPSKTLVCQNLIETVRYQTPAPPDDDGPVRVMWAGGGGHWKDLTLIDNACCRIKEKWGDKVEFHFLGDIPDNLGRDWLGNGVRLTDWYHLSEHWFRLNQVRPHVTLSPLSECVFNHCKSNIRVLEAWSLNSALVASPVGEYKVVRHGEDGLVASDERDWFDSLDTLISDRPLRESLARTGYRRVSEEWNWNSKTARQKWAPLIRKLDEWDSI